MADISALRGCGTALVTPFKDDLSIDEEALVQFVEFQISEGIDFLVPCGTTGESVTLSYEEQRRVVELVLKAAAGRVPADGDAADRVEGVADGRAPALGLDGRVAADGADGLEGVAGRVAAVGPDGRLPPAGIVLGRAPPRANP